MCVIALRVNRSENAKNWSIYCITSICIYAKAESCLCNVCMCNIHEFNVWIKRCYCFMCDCAACKSIWKCEKSINLLHHVCLYIYVKVELYLCNICMYVVYESQYVCKDVAVLLCICKLQHIKMIALLLFRFSTVYKLNAWVKRCYCSVNIDEIV